MIYISFVELLPEGIAGLEGAGNARAELWGVIAFFGGLALIALIDRCVPEEINPHEEPHHLSVGGISRARMRNVGLVAAAAIAIHNFPEGFATFAVALSDPALAAPLAIAIAIHNIPEGVAVAVPMREATGSRWKAFGWATLSGLAEPLGALIGFLLLQSYLGRDYVCCDCGHHGLCQSGQTAAHGDCHRQASRRDVRHGCGHGSHGRKSADPAGVAPRRPILPTWVYCDLS